MNCPRCGKPIGGYVRAGTIENARVAKGLCPHCGCTMPSGYKVGYASSFAPPPPKKYDSDVCRDMAEKGKTQILVILLDGLLLGLTVSLAGKLVLGIILGVALCLIFGAFVLIRPAAYFATAETTTAPPGNVAIWMAWVLSIFLSFTVSISTGAVPKGWPFLLAGFGLTVFCTIKSRIPSYEEGKVSFRQQQRNKQLTERIGELYSQGKLTCGKCGRPIGKYDHFSFSLRDDGAIVLCADCLPVVKSGEMKLGELTFYQL